MGLSSGKLATYARSGVPSVIMGNPCLRTFLERDPFGVYVDTATEISSALSRIGAAYHVYSDGAVRFFREHLDFDRFWPAVWRRIESVRENAVPRTRQ